MRSSSEPELSAILIEHLADIAAGRCTITDEEIDKTASTDPVLAEILTGLLFLHEDLAHRSDERDRALAEAETANRELEAFSYSVAHDLRAPLSSILGFGQFLEDSLDRLDAQSQKYVLHIMGSARRMTRMIEDLLSLSRVSSSEPSRETVDLSSLARDVLSHLRGDDPDRRVETVIEEGLTCVGDPGLLAIMLANLLGNAWKFTRKRDLARIEFGVQPASDPAVYFVRDNGAGFDMAYASTLFGVFQRLHTADEFEGTGIGLATVQRIVGRHGGRVWAEGEVDRGATVYFTLEETKRMDPLAPSG